MPTASPAKNRPSRKRAAPTHGLFDIDCRLSYDLPGETPFLFQIHALHGQDQQVLAESLTLSPQVLTQVYPDPWLDHRYLRLTAPAGPFELRYTAHVRIEPRKPDESVAEVPVTDLPNEVMPFLLPSRYCEADLLAHAALRLFGNAPRGFARVQRICEWIREEVDYRIGTSDTTTTARDVFWRRRGVCRDFAHLGVAFCRALNIPARLVAGYAIFDEPPPDFHAVFEAFLGGRWWMFDPTGMSPVDRLVRIAAGRDATDVAFATIFGAASMRTMEPLIQPSSG